jgi:16S rRNA (uracil1498-N3)-methyltransferase
MMQSKIDTAHAFALYYPLLSSVDSSGNVKLFIEDQEYIHRIATVLRLDAGDTILLFDRLRNCSATIVFVSKKRIEVHVANIKNNVILSPEITILLPLLKRDAFEQALYACVELGATSVQLIITDKMQKNWQGKKDYERAQAIMIAAAEQSKNFALPQLLEPLDLAVAVAHYDSGTHTKLLFAVHGDSLLGVVTKLSSQQKSLVLAVGPEGDFTQQEYALLAQHTFQAVKLTPTVLRSFQALVVGLGAIRSCVR